MTILHLAIQIGRGKKRAQSNISLSLPVTLTKKSARAGFFILGPARMATILARPEVKKKNFGPKDNLKFRSEPGSDRKGY